MDLLGIQTVPIKVIADGLIVPCGAGMVVFPFVISKKFIDYYWNSTTRTPVLENGVAPTLNLSSDYHINSEDVLSGQWTFFTDPDASAVIAVLTTELPIGQDVAVLIVNDATPNSMQHFVAIVGFHITGSSQSQKYIAGYFINNANFGAVNPGTRNGMTLGGYGPPILVQ